MSKDVEEVEYPKQWQGDFRRQIGTAIRTGDGRRPQRDEYDPRIAWWFGKRIYLGNDTQVSRLFWLLADPPGRAYCISQVQKAIDGYQVDESLGSTIDDVRKAEQRVRKVTSRLRKEMQRENMDDHIVLARNKGKGGSEMSMIFRHGELVEGRLK
jgi:hypothetical protein